jgi:hypothetical protein
MIGTDVTPLMTALQDNALITRSPALYLVVMLDALRSALRAVH